MSERPPRRVEVVDRDPMWAVMFEAARAQVAEAVPEALSIEHIGSTAARTPTICTSWNRRQPRSTTIAPSGPC